MKATSALRGIFAASLLPASLGAGVIDVVVASTDNWWVELLWLGAFGVCLLHAILLAPALCLLNRMASLCLKSALATGFLVGSLPTTGFLLFPSFQSDRSLELVKLLETLIIPMFTGFLGAIGAWGFIWAAGLVTRHGHNASEETPNN